MCRYITSINITQRVLATPTLVGTWCYEYHYCLIFFNFFLLEPLAYIILPTIDNQVPLVPVWVVQCTPGGGGQYVQTSLEHNSCMLEELLEATGTTREGEPTTSAYLMTQATYSTDLGHKRGVVICMVQSTTPQLDLSQHFKTTMCHVQCVMFPPEEQC